MIETVLMSLVTVLLTLSGWIGVLVMRSGLRVLDKQYAWLAAHYPDILAEMEKIK